MLRYRADSALTHTCSPHNTQIEGMFDAGLINDASDTSSNRVRKSYRGWATAAMGLKEQQVRHEERKCVGEERHV